MNGQGTPRGIQVLELLELLELLKWDLLVLRRRGGKGGGNACCAVAAVLWKKSEQPWKDARERERLLCPFSQMADPLTPALCRCIAGVPPSLDGDYGRCMHVPTACLARRVMFVFCLEAGVLRRSQWKKVKPGIPGRRTGVLESV